jgi:hypothetical protein
MFLETKVLYHPIYSSSRHGRARTTLDGTPFEQTLGIKSIQQYINAVVNLWLFQKTLGINSSRNP